MAYLAAVTAGSDTAPAYGALYSACHTTATALAPVSAASMATPSDASGAQAAAASVAAAIAGLPDLTVRQPQLRLLLWGCNVRQPVWPPGGRA